MWQEQLHDAVHVEQALGHLHGVLAMRSGGAGRSAGALSLQQVVTQVQQLVEGEARVQATHDAFASVEHELRSNPQGGLQRVVRHFQDLFGVTSIEGCLPMMSKVCPCCANQVICHRALSICHCAVASGMSSTRPRVHPVLLSTSGSRDRSGCCMHTHNAISRKLFFVHIHALCSMSVHSSLFQKHWYCFVMCTAQI